MSGGGRVPTLGFVEEALNALVLAPDPQGHELQATVPKRSSLEAEA